MKKGIIPDYVKVYHNKDSEHVALFNQFSLRLAYIGKEAYRELIEESDINEEILEKLKINDFIVNRNHSLSKHLYKANQIASNEMMGNDVFILKMFLTTQCNFNCKYCLIEQNMKFSGTDSKSYLSRENARKAIDEFCEVSSESTRGQKIILFYGGEPLLNWDTLKDMIAYARTKEADGAFNGAVELTLETNGSLITHEIAEFLNDNNVFLIVSMDGPPGVHNKMRVYETTEEPTFEDVYRGIKIAREHGCLVVTSAVFHKHSSSSIEEVIEFLAKSIKTPSTGLDLLHLLDGKENPGTVKEDELAKTYIRAFEVSRELGIYVEHVIRRIRPFVEEKFRLRDCGACGSRIVVAPDGKYGQCEGFIHSRQYFSKESTSMMKYLNTDNFKEWKNRLHFNFEKCMDCAAIGICGGGCPYNSYVDHGTIYNIDSKTCETSKAFIEFLIWDLYDLVKLKTEGEDIYIPTIEDKTMVLKSIPCSLNLPLLQTQSKAMEVEFC